MNVNKFLFRTVHNELLDYFQDERDKEALDKYLADEWESPVEFLPNERGEDTLEKYLVDEFNRPENLNDVYMVFVRVAAHNNLPKQSIKRFEQNETEISYYLRDYSYEYVSSLESGDQEDLHIRFKRLLNCETRGSFEKWFHAVVDSAKYISSYNDIGDFLEFVEPSSDLEALMSVPDSIANPIRGIAFKSACDVLTKLGFREYARPNPCLYKICTELKISREDDHAAFKALREIADDNKISPFKLNKLFQLVCYGEYFKENRSVKANENRDKILKGAKSLIAVNSLINSFDKLDISKSAPEDLNNIFETRINEEDIACIKEESESNRNNLLVDLLRPFASEDSDTDIVEAEGYINRVETLEDERIKVTFTITNDNMHKFNLMYLYSNFKKSEDGDYYIPLTFEEKAKHGYHLIDDLYYPFEYYYECIVSKDEAIKRKWLNKTKEIKYYKLEIKDLGTSVEESDDKTDGTGRIIFYDEENVRGGKNIDTKPIKKPESCNGKNIRSEHSTDEYFEALFDSYKESEVDIYRVGQGNFITLRIYYTDPVKEPKFLVFDAGTNKDKSVVDTNAASLQKSIKQFNHDEVYFMLSHYHKDHRTIMTAAFEKMKTAGKNKDPKAFCILPKKGSHKDFDTVKLYSMGIFKERARIVDGVAGQKLYEKDGIKVFQGKPCSDEEWKNINSQSLMIQLKNTLLPGDSYYRYWPDEYGQVNSGGISQYRKFKNIVAPHHGYNVSNDDVDRDRFKNICDINDTDTRLYITRNDIGYNGSTEIKDLLVDLGVPGGTGHSHVEITYTSGNNRANPISFKDS